VGADSAGAPASGLAWFAPEGTLGYLRLLGQRPVLVLWLAQSLSVLGDRLYALAVWWVVYQSTGSASLTGLVAVAESVPYIVLGTAGRRVVARFSTFGRLAWVDAARAAAAVALPFLWSPDARGIALLLVGVLLLGTLGALFDPNLGALVPDLVEPEKVQQITGLLDLTGRIARIAGPASIGLLLLLVSEVQLFALNGVTFAVSAVALGWLARRYAMAAGGGAVERPGKARSAVRAWPVVQAHPRVGLAVGLHGVALFCSAVTAVGMPALLATQYGAGAAVYGLVTAAVGVGALLGNPLASNRRSGGWLGVYCGAWAVQGVATACMGLVLHLPALMLLALVTGLVTPATSVTLRAHLGAFAPSERLRLMSVDQTVIRTGGTVGMLLLPFLVDASPRGAFVAGGVMVAGSALAALLASSRLLRPDAALPVPATRGRAMAAE
jgi:MFS family permease